MPLRAISPPAIHNLNAVECSEDEEGSSYPDSYRNQHPRHVSCLHWKETSREEITTASFQRYFPLLQVENMVGPADLGGLFQPSWFYDCNTTLHFHQTLLYLGPPTCIGWDLLPGFQKKPQTSPTAGPGWPPQLLTHAQLFLANTSFQQLRAQHLPSLASSCERQGDVSGNTLSSVFLASSYC